jgi:hypothetical protein
MKVCRSEIEWTWGVARKRTRVVGLQRILRSEVVLQHPLKRRTEESLSEN